MSDQEDRVLRLIGEKPAAGSEIINDVRDFVSRFCVFPSEHCLTAVTLWAVHAHIIEHLYTTPRLALLSPEAASGKTRVLEVLDLLVPAGLFTLNASPAAIFRLLAQEQITLLFDEVDAIWNKRGKDDTHEDLRALLNAGYKRGASIPRCVGPRHDVTRFAVYCAVALAGLGDLPETIMSRSIIIRMRRRTPGEPVEPFRLRTHEPTGHGLRSQLETWAQETGEAAGVHVPNMPAGIVDRPAEVWEPLLIVADLAGGEWPQAARAACVALCDEAGDRRASLGVRLLADIRTLFDTADAMHSATIVDRLTTDHEQNEPRLDADAPWSDLRGKPLTQRGLASLLRRYNVRPIKVRVGADVLQGYRRTDLYDAWQRYLPSVIAAGPEHPEQAVQANTGAASSRPTLAPGVPDVPRTPVAEYSPERQTQGVARGVPDVPDVPDLRTPVRGSGCSRCAGEGCRWCA